MEHSSYLAVQGVATVQYTGSPFQRQYGIVQSDLRMGARWHKSRGEQSDGGFWSRNGQTPLICLFLNIWRMSKKGLSHLINAEVEPENSEVISI